MKNFSRVCQRLESVPFHRDKAGILAGYLKDAPVEDHSWALYLLLGGQLPELISPASAKSWILAHSGLPDWLFETCREQTSDFSETVALWGGLSRDANRTDPVGESARGRSLRDWIELHLLPLAQATQPVREAALFGWWQTLGLDLSWVVHALCFGKFPVHISRRIAEQALRKAQGDAAIPGLNDQLSAKKARLAEFAKQLELF